MQSTIFVICYKSFERYDIILSTFFFVFRDDLLTLHKGKIIVKKIV